MTHTAASTQTATSSEPAVASAESLEARKPEVVIDLDDPSLFFNRELSWLRFNEQVLAEALDQDNPLLERVNFLSIFASNLDEFFMVRVAGLRRQRAGGVLEPPPDGMSPSEQLAAIRERLLPNLEQCVGCWHEDLVPKLQDAGVRFLRYGELKKRQRKLLRRHFEQEIFPILTPLAFDPAHPFPHISNLSLNLAVVVKESGLGERFARLKVPPTIPRLLALPAEEEAAAYESLGLDAGSASNFVWLEEVIVANLDLLFPGVNVVAAYPFRVTRDADFEIEEDEASDLLSAMAEVVEQRYFGFAVRLEIDEGMPDRIRDLLTQNMGLAPYQVFTTAMPLGWADLRLLTSLDRPGLKFPPFLPVSWPPVAKDESLFTTLVNRNILMFHPFDSFSPVVQLVHEAATDPDVLAIKVTLYRAGTNSPLVEALMEARQNGKQVAALVELKARFDEENNIGWARALERAGVHVVYGVLGLKTHAKVLMVVRRESNGIRRYVHLSTGNYNPTTARLYTDIGYFTFDPAIARDAADLFNVLTGLSRKRRFRKLLIAPGTMRDDLISRIDREIEIHQVGGKGRLIFKMNSLVDKACIHALYRASQAGVKIDLQVRGICCLRPGVAGVSENISVVSIVGRFLEHARVYYFHNGGDEEIYMGSADLMPRNLDHRVEVLFPVEDPRLKRAIRHEILETYLHDDRKARRLLPDGCYQRVPVNGGHCAQQEFLDRPASGGWRTLGEA